VLCGMCFFQMLLITSGYESLATNNKGKAMTLTEATKTAKELAGNLKMFVYITRSSEGYSVDQFLGWDDVIVARVFPSGNVVHSKSGC
jgi:hypothetical protein